MNAIQVNNGSTESRPTTFRAVGRFDRQPVVSPEQARALADFHRRTDGAFDRVTDLSLIGTYARSQGWEFIAEALLPARTGGAA